MLFLWEFFDEIMILKTPPIHNLPCKRIIGIFFKCLSNIYSPNPFTMNKM